MRCSRFGEFGHRLSFRFWHCEYEPARAHLKVRSCSVRPLCRPFPDLRWPYFSDDSTPVEKFYELNGGFLRWVKGMGPTTQARQIIALMLQADQKGAPHHVAISAGPIPVMHWPASTDSMNPLRAR
jgi:hypothetical protein